MKPKYEVGNKVEARVKYSGQVTGEIVEMTRVFAELWDGPESDFRPGGLHSLERDCPSNQVPWEINGDILKVEMPEMKMGGWTHSAETRYSRLCGYAYSIDSPELGYRVLVDEKQIIRLV